LIDFTVIWICFSLQPGWWGKVVVHHHEGICKRCDIWKGENRIHDRYCSDSCLFM